MISLASHLRNKLAGMIIEARDTAEKGSRAALKALAVHHHEPYGHMSPEERRLRNRLRAHARQLGDALNTKTGIQNIDHLAMECAYEHWHQMLFARFLAENHLLIEPELGVAISMEECEELAKEQDIDPWALASRYAQKMLPQIFRPDDPPLQITFAREHRLKLEQLLISLAPAVFTATDSLGWVYQFWQNKRKEEVNRSEKKIGADELPAVTQLFTEPYMVQFLIHNTLGAWHAGRCLSEDDLNNAKTEGELRVKAALPAMPLDYLRFVKVEAKVEAASSRLKETKASSSLHVVKVEAASSRLKEIGYFQKDDPIANLSGNLPHWRQERVTYFVTFRTADSLPQEKLKEWQSEKEAWLSIHPQPHDEKTKSEFYEKFPERLQYWLDKGYGECLLEKAELKAVVENALWHFDGTRYDLDKFVVMPNHVHVLVTPKNESELTSILHSWKSFTSNEINKQIGHKGTFWQKESFDHIVRSPDQLERIRRYIREHNKRQDAASTMEEGYNQGHSSYEGEIKRQDAASTMWQPAAGTFDKWPKKVAELKVLDPCCGSGHFLVAVFQHLVPLRMAEEGLSAKEACDAVLRENLFGLEIDERCTQIAAFALALSAWNYPSGGGYRKLPQLNIACSGLAVSVAREEWKKLSPDNQRLSLALGWMHDQFKEAPVLGSLLNPAKSDAAKIADWRKLSQALEQAIDKEQTIEEHEMGVVAHGLAKAAKLLAEKYHWVITNVPYLKRGKQCEKLQEFCDLYYKVAKNELATVFLDRCLEFCQEYGTASIVLPQNWLFLTTYKKFREKLLRNDTWHLIARLGSGAFETISGEIVKAILLSISKGRTIHDGLFVQKDKSVAHIITGLDVSAPRTIREKAAQLITARIQEVCQDKQLKNPDARVILEELESITLLAGYSHSYKGITTGNDLKYRRFFWEFQSIPREYSWFQSTVDSSRYYGGCESVIWYEKMVNPLKEGVYIRAKEAWGKKGVMVTQMQELPIAKYNGVPFDTNAGAIIPVNPNNLPAIWCFCSSPEYNQAVRQIDQSLKVTNATLVKVPFDLAYWQKIAEEKYPNGLPKPYSDDPTQWIFHGHPAKSEHALQVAVTRLLGYRWPAELDMEIELSDEAWTWVKKCEDLLPYADEDGIIGIPSVRGEDPGADRLRAFLSAAFDQNWSPTKEQELIEATGIRSPNLEDWLRNYFFEQHCKLFHHRPFIWHIWDGRKHDGFHALVNYHKLAESKGKGRRLLETLTYSYLGDWIARQKDGVKQGTGGAEDRLAAALELEKRLKAILDGEPPYDIFVRWKPIDQQPIGWEPDINDGVRLNIRPFMADDIPGGKRGAGILRWKPNIKWEKDRGKGPSSSPWYHLFKGDRINNHHLSNEEKRTARGKE